MFDAGGWQAQAVIGRLAGSGERSEDKQGKKVPLSSLSSDFTLTVSTTDERYARSLRRVLVRRL